ncbi:MAG: HAMP domain-containing sensor histidine kinase [Melioribacteraceae bacterium]
MNSNSIQSPLLRSRKSHFVKSNTIKKKKGIENTNENQAFFSIVSHNIKNPFASLLGFTDLLFEDFDELNDEERKYYLEEIKKSAQSTFNYTEKFFEWIYYRTGKIDFTFSDLNLRSCVENTLLKIEKKYPEEKSISVNVDEFIEVRADEDSLEKILFNLVENAILFSKPNPVISIKAEKNNDKIKIIISDNGIGIKEEDLTKIFDLAKDPSTIGESSYNGSGISLILIKELVEQNNGTIHIESNFGEGSNVSFFLEGK